MNIKRKLATIQTINKIDSIEGANTISLAHIKGWDVVIKTGEFKEGDKCIYIEIDSILPELPEFEFLRRHKFRIKTIKFMGKYVSQGVCFPISILKDYNGSFEDETDLTDVLGVKKYEIPEPKALNAKSDFPSSIVKTDEMRIQNIFHKIKDLENSISTPWGYTEKLNGTSVTIYYNNETSGICSRNLELKLDCSNEYINNGMKYLNILDEYKKNIALQGEIIGPGIQKNMYGISSQCIKFFNVYDIDNKKYFNLKEFNSIVDLLKLETVPFLGILEVLPDTCEELLNFSNGVSVLNSNVIREGLVFRNTVEDLSFKVISNEYLIKNKE